MNDMTEACIFHCYVISYCYPDKPTLFKQPNKKI